MVRRNVRRNVLRNGAEMLLVDPTLADATFFDVRRNAFFEIWEAKTAIQSISAHLSLESADNSAHKFGTHFGTIILGLIC